MSTTSILILGGSTMQLPAIEAARAMGWRVTVADRDPEVPGASSADEFLPVDLADHRAMREAAQGVRDRVGLDGVFTAGTDFSSTVAYVAEGLGLPGIPYEVALDASDKARMRRVFSEAGLASPRFVVVGAEDNHRNAAATVGFPLVVKPVDNMGARGVRRVDSAGELDEAVTRAMGFSRSSRVIIEEFVPGPEFSLDALVYRGEITLCGIADRHIRFPPYFVEIGHTIPSAQPVEVRNTVTDLFFRGIDALGIHTGAAKGDIKYGPDGPVIGEIAARLSGGYMSGWTYPYSSGVALTSAALRIAVGLPPGDLRATLSRVSAERAFFSIPGTVCGISGLPEGEDRSVRAHFVRVARGDRVRFPRNNVDKCGNIIAAGDTRARVIESAEAACRRVVVRLRPGDAATRRFLAGESDRWVPDAFRLRDPANVSAFADMTGPVTAGSGRSAQDLSIRPIPAPSKEPDRDWLGRGLDEALKLVADATGVVAGVDAQRILGADFWRALLRGSVQGAVWYIDTVRARKKEI